MMSKVLAHHRGYRFGEFVLDLDRGTLFREDREIPLRPKAFDVLRLLVERAGVLVTKDDLLENVWPNSVVCDDSLSQCLFEIRRALGDRRRKIVRTVPRRGVIFDLPVSALDGQVSDAEQDAGMRGPRLRWPFAVFAVFTVAALALAWSLRIIEPTQPGHSEFILAATIPAASEKSNSIAVLAFEDLTPQGDHQWFAEGLSEEVLNRLARVPGLNVIARTSSFSLSGSGAGIPEIAERLRVGHVLEGSVRKDGDTLRITAQLVAANSNTHLWSGAYDRQLHDVFGVQSDIALAVVEALQLELTEWQPPPVSYVPNAEAWSLHLHAQYLYNRRRPGDLVHAADLYRQAVERDPQLAVAWAGLAATYQVMIWRGVAVPARALQMQDAAARRALELAPQDATVVMRASRAAGMVGDHERKWTLYYRALELDPNNLLVLGAQAGFSMTAPERDVGASEALELTRRYARLDPLGRISQFNLGVALLRSGLYREAEAQLQYVQELDPANTEKPGQLLALAQLLDGRPAEALSTARSQPEGTERHFMEALIHFTLGNIDLSDQAVVALSKYDDVASAVRLAEVFSYRDDPETALQWLDTARQRLEPSTPWFHGPKKILVATHDPLLLRHRAHPRFMAQLEEVRREMIAIERARYVRRETG